MVGIGYDSHRLAEGKKLILGGIEIESELGTIAHSDGDALLHALTDAILGACALGDIGDHFPDANPEYKNADSSTFVRAAVELAGNKGYELVNVDAVIMLERPKLGLYKTKIRENVAAICGLPESRVNIKAKSGEKIGFVGRSEGVAVICTCEMKLIQ